jgi:hypothetical protein
VGSEADFAMKSRARKAQAARRQVQKEMKPPWRGFMIHNSDSLRLSISVARAALLLAALCLVRCSS